MNIGLVFEIDKFRIFTATYCLPSHRFHFDDCLPGKLPSFGFIKSCP